MLNYITDTEYKKLIGVDSIPDNFNNLVIEASTYINSKTFNRIDATALIIQKMDEAENQKKEIGNLKSQNIEGWSESYATPEEIDKKLEVDKLKIIKQYLWNVIGKDGQPLLYSGGF